MYNTESFDTFPVPEQWQPSSTVFFDQSPPYTTRRPPGWHPGSVTVTTRLLNT